MFYGIIIRMLYMDNRQHHLPHLHVEYQGMKSVVTIPDGELLEGKLPAKKLRLVQAWITIHEDEVMANWSLAVNGEPIFSIDPLR
jgi:shikimate kinase